MTNKQLYNIVFEKFIQAKKELIREGYRKTSLDEVDFNEVFNKTKHQIQEAKIQSLLRENKMLKRKLQESLVGSMGSTGGYGETGGAGSETVGNWMTKGAAALGSTTAKADIITDKMIEKGMLSDSSDISKFRIKVRNFLKSGLSTSEAAKKAMSEIQAQTLGESKRRK